MNYDILDYLTPLFLEDGKLPLGRLIYRATGEIYPYGNDMENILKDIDELCENKYILIINAHNRRHRRIERSVCLTDLGRKAREKALEQI